MVVVARLKALLVGAALGSFVVFPALSEPIDLSSIFPTALIGDFNSDGADDALLQPPNPKENGALYRGGETLPETPDQVIPPALLGLAFDATHAVLHVGDFDGDSHDDVYAQPLDASGTHGIYVANAKGYLAGLADAFNSKNLGFDWSAGASAVTVGDFDGDQRDGVILQGRTPNSPVGVMITDEQGQFVAGVQTWSDGFLGRHWSGGMVQLYSGDFDGDGRDDLLLQVREPALTYAPYYESAYAVALSRAGGVFTAIDQVWDSDSFGADWDPERYALRVGDYDGDGIADFALMAKSQGGTHQLLLGTASGRPGGVALRWQGAISPKQAYLASQSSFSASLHANDAQAFMEDAALAKEPDGGMMAMSFTAGVPAVGILAGSAGVSGGAASYSISIVVPPGRAGIQPSVSIGYSSRGGNGELGMGWSLSAGSSISRCPQTIAQDGQSIGVTYSATTDRLCLDGQRLLAVSGTYGASGAIYRTELESYQRVAPSGAINGLSTTYTIKRPDGSSAYYGTDANSRYTPTGAPAVLSWLLKRVEDAAGNSLIYTYDRSVAGEVHLASISYTGRGTTAGDRVLSFTWEDRPDVSSSWLASGLSVQSKRLAQIATAVGAQTVREYRLSYLDPSLATGRSRLASVEECAFQAGTRYCLPSTTFDWGTSDAVPNFAAPAAVVGGEQMTDSGTGTTMRRLAVSDETPSQPMAYLDSGTPMPPLFSTKAGASFIGRGAKQFWWQQSTLSGSKMLELPDTAPATAVGSGWPSLPDPLWTHFAPQSRDTETDANNDGRVDTISVNAGFYKFNVSVWQSDTQVAFNTVTTNVPYSPVDSAKVADFTGDGKVDIMVIAPVSAGSTDDRVYLYKNISSSVNGSSMTFAARAQMANPADFPPDHVQLQRSTDFDGDGRTDVVLGNGYVMLNTSTSGSQSFSYVTIASRGIPEMTNALNNQRWGDVNGDGLEDFVFTGTGGAWHVRLNKGGTFGAIQSTGVAAGGASSTATKAVRLADLDNDGRMELIVPGPRIATACMQDILRLDPEGQWETVDLCGPALKTVEGMDAFDNSIYRMKVYRFVSSANGTQSVQEITGLTIIAPGTGFDVQDTNGDGLSDIVWAVNRESTQQVYDNTCNGGCAFTFPAYGVYRSIATNEAPELMLGVSEGKVGTDGGHDYAWTYDPLTADKVTVGNQLKLYKLPFDKGNYDAQSFYFTSTMYVVSKFKQAHHASTNGGDWCGEGPACDETWNETGFGYSEAVYDKDGRGFLGFRTVTEEDPQRDLRTVSTFELPWPKTGKLLSSVTTTSGGAQIGTVANTWSTRAISGGTTAVVLDSSTAESDDPTSGTPKYLTVDKAFTYDTVACTTSSSATTKDYFAGSLYGTYAQSTSSGVTSDMSATWWPCKVNDSTSTSSISYPARNGVPAGSDSKSLKTTVLYNARRQVLTETVDTAPSVDLTLRRVTNYGYEDTAGSAPYGNRKSVSVSGGSGATLVTARTTTTTQWSNDGYFAKVVTNPLSQAMTTIVDAAHGQPTQVTDPNGVDAYASYDAFGRKSSSWVEDLPPQTVAYADCFGCDGVAFSRYTVTTTQAGSPTQVAYFDSLNRGVQARVMGFDGIQVMSETAYDSLGRTRLVSEPHYAGAAAYSSSTTDFDVLGRVTASNDAKGVAFSNVYSGLITTVTAVADGITQTSTQEKDGLGHLITAIDALGGMTHFRYDAFGNPTLIRDAIGATVTTGYNAIGQKTALADPDLGSWSYAYNVLGELKTQTDAKAQVTTNTYDNLGRVTSRGEPGTGGTCTTTWTYDTLQYGIGKPTSMVNGANCEAVGYQQTFQYDVKGRVVNVKERIDSIDHDVTTTYDAYGRVDTIAYPVSGVSTRFTVKQVYNANGYLAEVQHASGGAPIWTATGLNAYGAVQTETFGNNLTSSRTFGMPGAPFVTAITTSGGAQELGYSWNKFGQLTERHSSNGSIVPDSLSETFTYDLLNRLDVAQLSVSGGTYVTVMDLAYDATGNILSKLDTSGSKTYAYPAFNAPRPHAVTSAGGQSFVYDANGNMQTRAGSTISWNAANLPTVINGNGYTSTFTYGPSRSRVKEVSGYSGRTETTLFVGGIYEKFIRSDQAGTQHRYRVFAYGRPVAQVTDFTSTSVRQSRYLHGDHLGSTDTITNEAGAVVSRMSFDAHGNRRAAETAQGSAWMAKLAYPADATAIDAQRATSPRGFTDHEMLDNVGLIHMNGRVYDPGLGRFLSVDPVFQFPSNTQSLNPYTYVLNSPLSLTDPTGLAVGEDGAVIPQTDGAEEAAKSAPEDVNVKSSMGIMLHADSVSGVQMSNGSSTGEASDKKGTSHKNVSQAPDAIGASAERTAESNTRGSDDDDHYGAGVGSRPKLSTIAGGTGATEQSSTPSLGRQVPISDPTVYYETGAGVDKVGHLDRFDGYSGARVASVRFLYQETMNDIARVRDPRFANKLLDLSGDLFGATVDVHSAYRSQEAQDRMTARGKAQFSSHTYSSAADISVDGMNPTSLANSAYNSQRFHRVNDYGDGRVHVDDWAAKSAGYYQGRDAWQFYSNARNVCTVPSEC